MNINFLKLRNEIKKPDSNKALAKDSIIYSEFSFAIANMIEASDVFTSEELAMHTISLQSWITRKSYIKCKVPIKLGDIFLADLGSCYKPELAYPHPVVILEVIGSMVLIVPSSTSPNIVNNAYHPVDNPIGNDFYRKVKKSNGFNCDSALILSNIRAISQGRLLDHLGALNNINDSTSLFVEIKNKCFDLCFPKQAISLKKAIEELKEVKQKLTQLEKENESLKIQK